MSEEPLNPYQAPEAKFENAGEPRLHRPWFGLVRAIIGFLGLWLMAGWWGGEPAGTPLRRVEELSIRALGVVLMIFAFLPFGKPRPESVEGRETEIEEL